MSDDNVETGKMGLPAKFAPEDCEIILPTFEGVVERKQVNQSLEAIKVLKDKILDMVINGADLESPRMKLITQQLATLGAVAGISMNVELKNFEYLAKTAGWGTSKKSAKNPDDDLPPGIERTP